MVKVDFNNFKAIHKNCNVIIEYKRWYCKKHKVYSKFKEVEQK